MTDTRKVAVVLETSVGNIELELYLDKAPLSAQAFLTFVDDGSFARHGAFHRTVRSNGNDRGHPTIDVIQAGLRDHPVSSLHGVAHESTLVSGLRHLDGTISLARGEIGTATGEAFFICVGDQPALDAGGARQSDGQGFAACGRVTAGIETVHVIHRLPCQRSDAAHPGGQTLDPPVRISRAYRKSVMRSHEQ